MKMLSWLLPGLGLSPLAGLAGEPPLTPITVQLDWMAEPEHDGFYQASGSASRFPA